MTLCQSLSAKNRIIAATGRKKKRVEVRLPSAAVLGTFLLVLAQTFGTVSGDTRDPRAAKTRTLSLSLGYSHLRMLDSQVSPLIYRGNSAPLTIAFASTTSERILGLSLNATVGSVGSAEYDRREFIIPELDNDGGRQDMVIRTDNALLLEEGLNIQYLRRLRSSPRRRTTWYVGGLLKQYFLFSMDLVLFVQSEISLAPSVLADIRLNDRSSLTSSVSVPLVGVITRLPYANDPVDGEHNPFIATYAMGTRIAGLGSYQRLNVDLAYLYQLSSRWTAVVTYGFYWLHYSENRGLRAYDNSLHLAMMRKLGVRRNTVTISERGSR